MQLNIIVQLNGNAEDNTNSATKGSGSCKFHRLAKFIDDDFVLLSPCQTSVLGGDGNGGYGLLGMCVGPLTSPAFVNFSDCLSEFFFLKFY